MLQRIVRRVVLVVPVLLGASLCTFVLMHAAPGTPFDGDKITPEVRDNLLRQYGFDRPYPEQYLRYLASLLRGDLGVSVKMTGEPVARIIAQRFPVSLELGLVAALLMVAVGIPLGVVGALRQNTWVDHAALSLALLGYSLPIFVLGLLLLLGLSSGLHLLPVGGWGEPSQFVMPAFALGIGPASMIARLTRASMLDVIHQDFVRTAHAKGLPGRLVVTRHAIRNALIPVVTVVGAQVGWLITGSFIVEYMFSIPGLGQMFVLSAENLDYPLILGLALFYVTIVAIMNIAVDAAYTLANPRLRVG
jgi:oligopeptide transport system permease protein